MAEVINANAFGLHRHREMIAQFDQERTSYLDQHDTISHVPSEVARAVT